MFAAALLERSCVAVGRIEFLAALAAPHLSEIHITTALRMLALLSVHRQTPFGRTAIALS